MGDRGARPVRGAVARLTRLLAALAVLGVVVVGVVLVSGSATKRSSVPASAGGCASTVSPDMSAGAVAQAIVTASDATTVCMRSGSYPALAIADARHHAYVTVRPAPGARVEVAGIEVQDSSFLRFRGLGMSQGFNMRDSASGSSHDYQFIDDVFHAPLYGIVLNGGAAPIKRVLIEGNRIDGVHLEKGESEGRCDAGYAQGQDVTLDGAEGVVIRRNLFNQAAWHYIQGGSAGPEGVTVEHNLFTGQVSLRCSHLNVWQIWAGGENDTFTDNVVIGRGRGGHDGLTEEAATDGILFENGAGSRECGVKMRNTVIEGNLFVNGASSYEIQVYTTDGARIAHNTVVGSQWGTALLDGGCGSGRNYSMTDNIDVEDLGVGADFHFSACSGKCIFDANVSQDASAGDYGARSAIVSWSPRWLSTSWDPLAAGTPPPGFYAPAGIETRAGYGGGAGL